MLRVMPLLQWLRRTFLAYGREHVVKVADIWNLHIIIRV
jgi:hypothetical protein